MPRWRPLSSLPDFPHFYWASLTGTLRDPPALDSISPKFQLLPFAPQVYPPTLDVKPTYQCAKPPPTRVHKSDLQPQGGEHRYIYLPSFMSPATPGPLPTQPSPAQPMSGLDPRAYNSQQALQQKPLAGGAWEKNRS